MKNTIQNPIYPGFFPDPSFCRVGDDYYIVNSTFEWFPGVPIHYSRDLVHWRMIGHVLTRKSQLDLRGVADSAGVWAPSLSYADGKFWLIYTNIRTAGMGRPFKDIDIFLTTATEILGPWSEPIELNSSGFDPSLFHDEDGRKWLINMQWDFRNGHSRFAGIVAQEYDPVAEKLVGAQTTILTKPELIEGPNIYQRGGFYYLMLAEGGTGWNHGISMARSRNVLGPYELDPQHSVLTSRDDDALPLQKAGHGELVQTPAGEWWLAHLAGRPIAPERRCVLGRETCLQRVEWSPGGWLRLANGGHHAATSWPAPVGLEEKSWPATPARDDFDAPALSLAWSSLRTPVSEKWLDLTSRPGWLRLYGRDSLHSFFDQSLVAQRARSFRYAAETCLEFAPTHFTQSAGLICHYNTLSHFYLRVSHDEERGRIVGVVLTDDSKYEELTASDLTIDDWSKIYLRAEVDHGHLQFRASRDGADWMPVGPALDASKLSDDYGSTLRFTGSMIGLCAQDLGGAGGFAEFDYFIHRCDELA